MKSLATALSFLLVSATLSAPSWATNPEVKHYGEFRRMMQTRRTNGAVNLSSVLGNKYTIALGAMAYGKGEIVSINGKTWIDNGDDGIGKARTELSGIEDAVMLVTAEVTQWQVVEIGGPANLEQLTSIILRQAAKLGLDTNQPFPFGITGDFSSLDIHVINGPNPAFSGHGGKHTFFNQVKATRRNQKAQLVGFYSATNRGLYTHQDSSWHIHALIEEDAVAAHVDGLAFATKVTLYLPAPQ